MSTSAVKPSEKFQEAGIGKNKKETRYYWLQLPKDFFQDKVMRKLRRLPGGDLYTIVALKILLLGVSSDSRIYFEGIEKTFPEEIALSIDEDPVATEVVVNYLLTCGWLISENSETLLSVKSRELTESISARTERWRRQKERESAAKIAATLPQDCRTIAIEEDADAEVDEEAEEKGLSGKKQKRPLWELFPDAFTPLHPKASPSLEEVISFHQLIRSEHVDPTVFYETFASQDWTADGKDITDWQTLYMKLDIAARDNSGDRE